MDLSKASLDATKDPAVIQKKVLTDLVKRNKVSLFGLEHDFNSIKSVDDFGSRSPFETTRDFGLISTGCLTGSIQFDAKAPSLCIHQRNHGESQPLPVTESLPEKLSPIPSRCWLT